MKKNATVVVAMCPQSKTTYGIRIEKRADSWVRTWAFPIRQDVAAREHFETDMDLSNFSSAAEYPNCPYCNKNAFLQCGRCKKIYCFHGEQYSVCPWCGNEGKVINTKWEKVSGGGY